MFCNILSHLSRSKRIVVTGFGVVTPLGHASGTGDAGPEGKLGYVERLLGGQSGLSAPKRFGGQEPLVNAVGYVEGCSVKELRKVVAQPKQLKYAGRPSEMALLAAHYALKDAGLENRDWIDPNRFAVCCAADQWALPTDDWVKAGRDSCAVESGNADEWAIADSCLRTLNPMWQLQVMTNGPAANLALQFGLTGPNNTSSSACSAGLNAMWEASRHLREGLCDFALAGGTDSKLNPWNFSGFCGLAALSRRECAPEEASAPCSKQRDGLVLSEASVFYVLERYETAARRNAHIYCEVAGFGSSCGAKSMTETEPDAVAKCIQAACRSARVRYDKLDLISAHATSTPAGDPMEVCGFQRALSGSAKKPLVYNGKCAEGHSIVASGNVTMAPAVLAIDRGLIPPNLNLDDPDPACNMNYPRTTVEKKVRTALVTALGFGGNNVAAVLRAV